MSDPRWVFKPKQPDDTTRDPISGEFFATEAIRNTAEALVREGVQNSLDAGLPGGPVRVRIALSGNGAGVAPSRMARYLEGIAPHLNAPGNGLREDQRPELGRPCQFLVFEDFGTRGLVGDPLQWHHVDGPVNCFFAFFRAEGESQKTAHDRRGRWGVGKFVFPRASEGSTYFGLTIRNDDRKAFLMGRSILKSHQLGSTHFVPDGYFGHKVPVEGGQLIAPVSEASIIAEFADIFGLARSDSPGLSLVIPWPDRTITRSRLIEAAARDWFYSILTGHLEIMIEDQQGAVQLTRTSFFNTLAELQNAELDREVLPMARLVVNIRDGALLQPYALPEVDTTGAPKWLDEQFGVDLIQRLRDSLSADSPLLLRVPIRVRRKQAAPESSYFDIYLQRDDSADEGRPVFLREGIIVSDARGGRARGYRSLVVCEHPPIADLLGDAENPSHTEWRPDTHNFKERYVYGPGYLSFVKDSVRSLVSRVLKNDEDVDPQLFLDLFSLPDERADGRRRQPVPTPHHGSGAETPPLNVPPPRPRRFTLTKVRGGFTVSSGDPSATPPSELGVAVAYDVRRGNPFSRYDPADFVLLQGDVQISGALHGLVITSVDGNRATFKVTSPEFRVTVAGFDVRRDLIVKVVARSESHEH